MTGENVPVQQQAARRFYDDEETDHPPPLFVCTIAFFRFFLLVFLVFEGVCTMYSSSSTRTYSKYTAVRTVARSSFTYVVRTLSKAFPQVTLLTVLSSHHYVQYAEEEEAASRRQSTRGWHLFLGFNPHPEPTAVHMVRLRQVYRRL